MKPQYTPPPNPHPTPTPPKNTPQNKKDDVMQTKSSFNADLLCQELE